MNDLQMSISCTEGQATVSCAAKFDNTADAIAFNRQLSEIVARANGGVIVRTPLMARLQGIRHQLVGSRT